MKTTNNWLRSNFLDVASGQQDKFVVEYKPYPFVVMGFRQAAEFTAHKILNNYRERQLYLGLSGGADSEFVARLFTELGIPFAPIIIKSDGNQADVMAAIDLCAELAMTPFVVRTTSEKILDYYLRNIRTNRNDGLNHVHQMLVVEKAAELGGVAILGESNIYDPDPCRSVIKSFKFLPDLIYSDVIPFYYYTIELTYAEMREVHYNGETAASFKARVRGTTFREKIYPKYTADMMARYNEVAATLKPLWLYHDMGTPKGFLEQMEQYTI